MTANLGLDTNKRAPIEFTGTIFKGLKAMAPSLQVQFCKLRSPEEETFGAVKLGEKI